MVGGPNVAQKSFKSRPKLGGEVTHSLVAKQGLRDRHQSCVVGQGQGWWGLPYMREHQSHALGRSGAVTSLPKAT